MAVVRGGGIRLGLTERLALRDAASVTALLAVAVWAGSGRFAFFDPALAGYLGATLVAAFGTTYRLSAFWRRPASAVYARALAHGLRAPRQAWTVVRAAGRDLAAQRFVARRSRARWAAHLLLSLGTMASVAITVPLVCGWMHFVADGGAIYRVIVFGLPLGRFAIAGPLGWVVFHALALAAVAVVAGAGYFLALRLRTRALPGVTSSFHVGPLVLLLAVALSGLALPATRGSATLFLLAARLHEALVVVLLVGLPFSKLGHVLVRPLHLGAQLVRAPGARRTTCAGCGAALAPVAQQAAVERLLAARGFRFDDHQRHCPACRRRLVATAQSALLGAHFQPRTAGARPASPSRDQAA